MSDNTTCTLLHAYQPDEAELIIPAWLQDQRFELRCLRSLVESVPDSLAFTRHGEMITFAPVGYAAVPWHDEVGRLVQRHFAAQLFELLPEGAWRLSVIYVDPEELAERYSGAQVTVESLRAEPTDAGDLLTGQGAYKIVVTDGEAIVARRHEISLGLAQYVPADNWQALAEQARRTVLAQGGLLHQEGPYRCPPDLAAQGTWKLPPAPLADDDDAFTLGLKAT